MANCTSCNGEGMEEYEEDEYSGRYVRDTCYHCAGSGQISHEESVNDQLTEVALTLAHFHITEYRSYIDSDGDGWELHAAENMMNPYDYFRVLVWDKQAEFIEKLSSLPVEDRELLIAWNNYND